MPSSYTLGPDCESFIEDQLASGRYSSAADVVCDALRLMEARERRRVALDVALREGLADAGAGRVWDAEQVFDELDAKYEALAAQPH